MKRLAIVLMSGVFVAASVRCRAEPACTKVAVEASVAAGQGELTLADLLAPDTCAQLRQEAAHVSLGAAPRHGSVRVLDGHRVRLLIEELANNPTLNRANDPANNRENKGEQSVRETASMQIPKRIVVQRAGATKSCAEIAGFLASALPAGEMERASGRWRENLDCAAARGIPQDAPLELVRTARNEVLQRWEFGLRCARLEDCVPFLVWVHEEKTAAIQYPHAFSAESSAGTAGAGGSGGGLLVQAGQTAILTWDQGGIRVVLPVTCLDAGGLGQFVSVRLKNAERTLRAEVVGKAMLRVSL